MRLFSRPSVGTVLGAVAIFIALGGQSWGADVGASAVRLISGSKIKPSTITGKQVKNGSLGETDLATAVRSKLDAAGRPGPAGAQGPVGTAGAPGTPGATGPRGAPGPVEDGSVTAAKLAPNAVTSAAIAPFGVEASDVSVFPHAEAFQGPSTVAQTVPNATSVPVQFSYRRSEDEHGVLREQPAGLTDLRVPKYGDYIVNASVRWNTSGAASPGAGYRALELYSILGSNPPEFITSSRIASAPDGYTDQELNVRATNIGVNDRLRLVATQSSGATATLSLLGNFRQPRIQATWVPRCSSPC